MHEKSNLHTLEDVSTKLSTEGNNHTDAVQMKTEVQSTDIQNRD